MRPELNACGFSTETIAAEYETDAALDEAGMDMADPYFLAAFAAENEQRELDRVAASAALPRPEDTEADPVAPYCDGFPTTCPNPVTVPPAPPHHGGGIRCGCYDEDAQ